MILKILKGFKQKSNEKYLNSILNSRELNVNNDKIKSLGIIFCIDELEDFELFRNLAEAIKVRPNKLKIIAYTESIKDAPNFWDTYYHSEDFGWNGKIKNVELQSFLDIKFDALVSYYEKDILELKLLTAMSKAKFKIGILKTDQRLNDFIIKTKLKEFYLFKRELIRYLNILKKI
ncbi:hypothetical protein RXV94_14160 [Yeosuana sp. MJ-SS3]|uniref:Uncharacterized protein n=1 Tax=Gilvirhabdus luticola TaxID=3079858 RepID=A0ABU3UA76_9FLAO|nr:hypothetical protein [Yeosuana sp. MJ-SS3]MDU8887311.1 hypothetical protein [Yeosuana sp. MJ-SS3]